MDEFARRAWVGRSDPIAADLRKLRAEVRELRDTIRKECDRFDCWTDIKVEDNHDPVAVAEEYNYMLAALRRVSAVLRKEAGRG